MEPDSRLPERRSALTRPSALVETPYQRSREAPLFQFVLFAHLAPPVASNSAISARRSRSAADPQVGTPRRVVTPVRHLWNAASAGAHRPVPLRSRVSRLVRRTNEAGRGPDNSALPCSINELRTGRLPSSDGTEPDSALSDRFSTSSRTRLPSSGGIDPVRPLPERSSMRRKTRLPSSGGIGPDRPLSGRLSADPAAAARALSPDAPVASEAPPIAPVALPSDVPVVTPCQLFTGWSLSQLSLFFQFSPPVALYRATSARLTGSDTVTCALPVFWPAMAVITALPSPTAVTRPSLLTVTTSVSLLRQETEDPGTSRSPSSSARALSRTVSPADARSDFSGVTTTRTGTADRDCVGLSLPHMTSRGRARQATSGTRKRPKRRVVRRDSTNIEIYSLDEAWRY